MSTTAQQPPKPVTPSSQALAARAAAASSMAVLNLGLLVTVGTLAVSPLGRGALAAGVSAAILSAVLAGILVPLLAPVRGQVTAPASSVVIIHAALAADLVHRSGGQASFGQIWASLALAVVLMGALLWVAGKLQLGEAVKFLPSPVTAGFITGIGLLVIWAQLPALLGLPVSLARLAPTEVAAMFKPAAALTGVIAAAAAWGYPRLKLPGPPMLAGLCAGTLAHHGLLLVLDAGSLGPTLGPLAPATGAMQSLVASWSAVDFAWLASTLVHVLPYAVFLALQAIVNAAVSGAAVAGLTGVRPALNTTLAAQGLANIACGLLAGLPVCTNASLSMPAARQQASGGLIIASSVVLVALAFLLGGLLELLPVPVLAAILITNGWGLIDRWARGLARKLWRQRGRGIPEALHLLLVAAVAAAFFAGGVPLALAVGAVLATVLLALDLSRTSRFSVQSGAALRSTRVWPSEQAAWLESRRDEIVLVRPRGGLFFGTADQLAQRLDRLPPTTRTCIVDLSKATTVDATACQMLASMARAMATRRVCMLIAGAQTRSTRQAELENLGLVMPPASGWFADADHALEWAEGELIGQQLADSSPDTADVFPANPLSAGLIGPDLEQLRAALVEINAPEGVLFRTGDDAASMFVVARGRVEIRVVHSDTCEPTRLASFGRGSIFGEISLLSTGRRSADAVCVEPSQLFELTRDRMDLLQGEHPALYACLLRNLGVHLANRLVIATNTLQALQ